MEEFITYDKALEILEQEKTNSKFAWLKESERLDQILDESLQAFKIFIIWQKDKMLIHKPSFDAAFGFGEFDTSVSREINFSYEKEIIDSDDAIFLGFRPVINGVTLKYFIDPDQFEESIKKDGSYDLLIGSFDCVVDCCGITIDVEIIYRSLIWKNFYRSATGDLIWAEGTILHSEDGQKKHLPVRVEPPLNFNHAQLHDVLNAIKQETIPFNEAAQILKINEKDIQRYFEYKKQINPAFNGQEIDKSELTSLLSGKPKKDSRFK